MFPSLAKESESMLFPFSKLLTCSLAYLQFSTENSQLFQLAGVRFVAGEKKVFVPGFFCQLIVEIFKKLNVSQNSNLIYDLNSLR